MAAKLEAQKKKEGQDSSEMIGDFLQRYRIVFFIGLISVLVILAGFITFSIVRGKLLSSALSEVDGFNNRYEALKSYIDSSDADALLKQVDLLLLLEEISNFTFKKSGFPAARAWNIAAEIYFAQKNWNKAEEAWVKAANAAPKTYLAPVSLFNAGTAAEEQENMELAIDYYKKSLENEAIFPSAARSQFSIGRLEESRGDIPAALEAYRNILSKWPGDLIWSNLAQSRILVLTEYQ